MNIMTIAQVINSEVLSPVSSHRPSPFTLRSRLIGPLLVHDSSFLLARLRSDLPLSFEPLFALRCSFLVSNSFLGLHCDPAKALYPIHRSKPGGHGKECHPTLKRVDILQSHFHHSITHPCRDIPVFETSNEAPSIAYQCLHDLDSFRNLFLVVVRSLSWRCKNG